MKKVIFSFLLFLSLVSVGFCQSTDSKNYTQKIPGAIATIDLVYIPKGHFLMGSPIDEPQHLNNESPLHNVKIDPFWMAKYEITWDIYRLFMERTIDSNKSTISKGNEIDLAVDAVSGATTPYTDMSFGMGTDGYPAISMTQLAASKFCEWLSALTGNFYRLPTEAEWEYACRSGSQTSYSFGSNLNELDKFAWYTDNSPDGYHKVGLKKPNTWGLFDMHGNVAEWTLDQFDENSYQKYKSTITENPFNPPFKTYPRVVRGGSWKDEASKLRSSFRLGSSKKWKIRDPQIPKSKWWHTDAPFVGFRIVRPVKTPSKEEQKKYWIN